MDYLAGAVTALCGFLLGGGLLLLSALLTGRAPRHRGANHVNARHRGLPRSIGSHGAKGHGTGGHGSGGQGAANPAFWADEARGAQAQGGEASAVPRESAAEKRFFDQLQNMLSYDGSESGQREIQ